MTTPALRGNTDLAEYDYSGITFEPDGNEDIQPSFPIIKLVQSTSSMKDSSKHAGEFWHSDYEDYTPTLDVVALLKRDTRAYFKDEDQPACASNDGVVPRENQPLWAGKEQPSACAECPFSQWGPNDEPPPCRESIVLLVDRGGDEPDLAQLRLNAMSFRPYKRFVSRKLAPKKLPIYTQRLHLTTNEKHDAGKKWFELVIENEPLPRAAVEEYVKILHAERERFTQSVAHEPEAQNGTTWGDGSESFAGQRGFVDPATGEVGVRGRAPTPKDTRPFSERVEATIPEAKRMD